MNTAGKISVPALRTLTYCILIKAILSMVMCSCTVATGFAMTHPGQEIPGLFVIFVIGETVRLLNSIVCIICLAYITALSKRFATAQAFIITGVVMESMVMLLVGEKAQIITHPHGKEEGLIVTVMLAFIIARRLLKAAGFMQIMQGFGEALRKDGREEQAKGAEKTGSAYMWCNIACVLLTVIFKPGVAVNAIIYFSWAVMELLMYRQASSAAFSIWRDRAFSDGE